MNTHINKTEENKTQSSSKELTNNKLGTTATTLVDNRPETITQRKLQNQANNSQQSKQLSSYQKIANNSQQTKQTAQLAAIAQNSSKQEQPIQRVENKTGLPDNLKAGIENLSGFSMNDVKVHYNSAKPAQLQAHAYAQGTDIHLAPKQEKHLPHEAWHVVQQKQGRVKPTMQLKLKVNVNDDVGLEKEADVMGAKIMQMKDPSKPSKLETNPKQVTETRNQAFPIQYAKEQQLVQLVDKKEKEMSNKEALANDTKDGEQNSKFSTPIATSLTEKGDMHVEMILHTFNKWDRVSWKCRVGDRLYIDLDKYWNNPKWEPSSMEGYNFKDGFEGFESSAQGESGVRRKFSAIIPSKKLKKVFNDDLSNLNESSVIAFGMEIWYYSYGPGTATKNEFMEAYDANPSAHMYGLGAMSSSEDVGHVDLSALGLEDGEWLTDEQVWDLDIEDNPSPNIVRSFPKNYENKQLIEPLTPKGGMKIATRIENEATLKVSSQENLESIIEYLQSLDEESLNSMMGTDDVLKEYEWSVSSTLDNSMVFTDVYLDDPQMTALRAGIGIRKRSSDSATKLNVKTGPGYQVGELDKNNKESSKKSDIYRRHEIGYSLAPKADIEDIREFLARGVEENDPWNKGGEQANLALPDKGKEGGINFKELEGTMVLQGDRQKFNLRGVKDGNVINIEISCDHTVGRTFKDYEDSPEPEDLFEGTYNQVFNVEMELEHLGAGSTTTPIAIENEGEHQIQDEGKSKTSKPNSSKAAPRLRPKLDHPGRIYLREDAANPKFNTPSFQVFSKAHKIMIAAMQEHLQSNTELKEDRQKLENLFLQLFEGQSIVHGTAPRREL